MRTPKRPGGRLPQGATPATRQSRTRGVRLTIDARETAMKVLWSFLAIGYVPLALAHEGHGQAWPHGHATDTLGFIVLGAVVAGAFWAGRRK